MMYYSHDGGWWWLMAITSTIFWIAIVVGIVALVAWVVRTTERPAATPPQSPRAILEERFARGEIDAEELQRGLRTLAGGGQGPAAGAPA